MLAHRIIPAIADTIEPDRTDRFPRAARRAHLDQLEQRRGDGMLPAPPELPGFHIFTGERGSGIGPLAGLWAYLYHAAGRTVISNSNLLYGYALDQPQADAVSLIAQAPEDCVLYLDEHQTLGGNPPKWKGRELSQVLDDAKTRGITVLLIPLRGGRMPSDLQDAVEWVHETWIPDFVANLPREGNSIPIWTMMREKTSRRVVRQTEWDGEQYLTAQYESVPTPVQVHSKLLIAAAACQSFARPAVIPDNGLDSDQTLDLGSLEPHQAYEIALRRVKSGRGRDIPLPVLRILDWTTLEEDTDAGP